MTHVASFAAPEDTPATSSTSYLQRFKLTQGEMAWVYQNVSNFRRLGWAICWRTIITEFNKAFQRELDPDDGLLREKMSQYCFRQARKERVAAQKPEVPRAQLREQIKEAILKFIQEGGKASAPAGIPWRIIVPKYLPNHEVSDVILAFRSGIQLQRDLLAIISERAEQFPSENWKGWVPSFKSRAGNRKPREANERTGSAKRRAEENPVSEEFDHSLLIHSPKRLESQAGCSAPQYTNEEFLKAQTDEEGAGFLQEPNFDEYGVYRGAYYPGCDNGEDLFSL